MIERNLHLYEKPGKPSKLAGTGKKEQLDIIDLHFLADNGKIEIKWNVSLPAGLLCGH